MHSSEMSHLGGIRGHFVDLASKNTLTLLECSLISHLNALSLSSSSLPVSRNHKVEGSMDLEGMDKEKTIMEINQ